MTNNVVKPYRVRLTDAAVRKGCAYKHRCREGLVIREAVNGRELHLVPDGWPKAVIVWLATDVELAEP